MKRDATCNINHDLRKPQEPWQGTSRDQPGRPPRRIISADARANLHGSLPLPGVFLMLEIMTMTRGPWGVGAGKAKLTLSAPFHGGLQETMPFRWRSFEKQGLRTFD